MLRCLLHILKNKEYLQCSQFVIEQTRTLPDQSKYLCDFQESIFWYKMVMGLNMLQILKNIVKLEKMYDLLHFMY